MKVSIVCGAALAALLLWPAQGGRAQSASQGSAPRTPQSTAPLTLQKLPPDLAVTHMGAGTSPQEINVRVANIGKGSAPAGEVRLTLMLYTFSADGRPLKPVWVSDGTSGKKSFHVVKKPVGALRAGGHEWATLTYFLPAPPVAAGEAPWPGLRIVEMTRDEFKKAKFGFVASLVVPKSTVGDLNGSNNEMARAFPIAREPIPILQERGFRFGKAGATPAAVPPDLVVTKIVNGAGEPDWVTVYVRNAGGAMRGGTGRITITLLRVSEQGKNLGPIQYKTGPGTKPAQANGTFGPLEAGEGYYIGFHFPPPPLRWLEPKCYFNVDPTSKDFSAGCNSSHNVIGMTEEEYKKARFGVEAKVALEGAAESDAGNNTRWRPLPLPVEPIP